MSLETLKSLNPRLDLQALQDILNEKERIFRLPSHEHYRAVLDSLPQLPAELAGLDIVELANEGVRPEDKEIIHQAMVQLIPWRKGPFKIFGMDLDAEWRSDLKWNRLKGHIKLEGRRVLDIGCNNGYYLFQMLKQDPEFVLGIDPVIHYWTQFQFIQHFLKSPKVSMQMWGVEHLSYFEETFDVIFSMGILYHHRDPIAQLVQMKSALRDGGECIIETMGIPGDDSIALTPEDRYGKMRNVYFLPTLNCLINWLKKSKFKEIEVLSVEKTTSQEQRLTEFCPPPRQSLDDFLDPNDNSKTIEGYPAPLRFCLKAKK